MSRTSEDKAAAYRAERRKIARYFIKTVAHPGLLHTTSNVFPDIWRTGFKNIRDAARTARAIVEQVIYGHPIDVREMDLPGTPWTDESTTALAHGVIATLGPDAAKRLLAIPHNILTTDPEECAPLADRIDLYACLRHGEPAAVAIAFRKRQVLHVELVLDGPNAAKSRRHVQIWKHVAHAAAQSSDRPTESPYEILTRERLEAAAEPIRSQDLEPERIDRALALLAPDLATTRLLTSLKAMSDPRCDLSSPFPLPDEIDEETADIVREVSFETRYGSFSTKMAKLVSDFADQHGRDGPQETLEAFHDIFLIRPINHKTSRVLARFVRRGIESSQSPLRVAVMRDVPEADDGPPPSPADGGPPFLVAEVTGRGFFDAFCNMQKPASTVRRLVPISIFFAASGDHYEACVVQTTTDGANLFGYRPLLPSEELDAPAQLLVKILRSALQTHAENAADDLANMPVHEQDRHAPPPPEPASPPMPRIVPRKIPPVARVRLHVQRPGDAHAIVDTWLTARTARLADKVLAASRVEGRSWLIEHRDAVRQTVTWAVQIDADPSDPGHLTLELRTDARHGYEPRLPTLLRDIAISMRTWSIDGPLQAVAHRVNSESAVRKLCELIRNPDRTLPVLIVTANQSGDYITDPDTLAAQTMGAMHVHLVGSSSTFLLRDEIGTEFNAHSGACRLIMPAFDPQSDTSFNHPLILYSETASSRLEQLVSREIRATLWRHPAIVVSDEPTTQAPAPEEPTGKAAASKAPVEGRALRRISRKARTFVDPKPVVEQADLAQDPVEDVVLTLPSTEDLGEHADETSASAEDEPDIPGLVEPETNADPDPMLPSEGFTLKDVEDLIRLHLQPVHDAVAEIDQRLSAETSSDPPLSRIAEMSEDFDRERAEAAELLQIAEAERDEVIAENASLRAALSAARDALARGSAPDPVPYPRSFDDVEEWARDTLTGRLYLMPRAARSMHKIAKSAPPEAVERACRALELLAGAYVDQKHGRAGAKEAWDEGLATLRLQQRSQTLVGGSNSENERVISYQGERLLLDKHLRGSESLYNDPRLIRIYYCYHEQTGQVIVGHLPTHLTTSDS